MTRAFELQTPSRETVFSPGISHISLRSFLGGSSSFSASFTRKKAGQGSVAPNAPLTRRRLQSRGTCPSGPHEPPVPPAHAKASPSPGKARGSERTWGGGFRTDADQGPDRHGHWRPPDLFHRFVATPFTRACNCGMELGHSMCGQFVN